MEIRPAPGLPEVLVVRPDVYEDDRGFFLETYRRGRYAEAGIGPDFLQDNVSRSWRGVLRGLHFQHPGAQGKLVTVLRGAAFDVAVDIRLGSPTFGRWFGVELSEENRLQVWIPPDFAHGFVALAETTDFAYKCTSIYRPECQHTLLWNDPDLGIEWPVTEPVVSEKDAEGLPLAELRRAEALPRHPT